MPFTSPVVITGTMCHVEVHANMAVVLQQVPIRLVSSSTSVNVWSCLRQGTTGDVSGPKAAASNI